MRGLCIALILFSQFIYAEPPGFLWYNIPKEQNHKKYQGTPFSSLSYSDRDAVLKFYTMEALHKARNTHDVVDMYRFLRLQNFWLGESSAFKSTFEKTILLHPELDYSVTHPISQSGIQLQQDVIAQKTDSLIEDTSNHFGLMFFYRGKNPFDIKEAPIVQDFAKKYHFSLLAVSVDGEIVSSFVSSKIDNGQAKNLGINYFPALVLVHPKTKKIIPIAYGFTTQDVIKAHLINVITAFKGVSS